MPSETIWSQDPHTAAKHDILRDYLNGWFAILGQRWPRILFLDGFAGPGVYEGGQQGSPLVALVSLLEHGHLDKMPNCEFVFLFNEIDQERFNMLSQLIEETKQGQGGWPKNVKVLLENSSFGNLVDGIVGHMRETRQKMAPTFAFIDPFGYKDVSMQQIADLLASPSSEAFIYLDTRSLNRFATSGIVDPHFEKLYGTDNFRDAPPAGSPDRVQFMVDLFKDQLKSVAGFPHSQAFQMRGAKNSLAYHLVFATRHEKGLDTMKKAMWKVDPSGEFKYSDTLHGQEVLFGHTLDTRPLRAALMSKFEGREVGVDVVEKFTVVETPYHSGQLRKSTLKPMEDDGLILCYNRSRKGTYPDGTRIQFIARS